MGAFKRGKAVVMVVEGVMYLKRIGSFPKCISPISYDFHIY
jgi:hypothetical protein